MRKLFNLPFTMLLCMAMVTVFTACEEEEAQPQLTFHCDGKAITDGSTFTIQTLELDVNLIGEKDGKVNVVVESLNQTMLVVCAYDQCVPTAPFLEYKATCSISVTANTALPLNIHSTPTGNSDTHRAEALITAYYEGDETNSVSFKLVMTNEK